MDAMLQSYNFSNPNNNNNNNIYIGNIYRTYKNILNLEKSCNFVTKCLKRLLDAISLLQNLLQTVTKMAKSVTNGLWTPFQFCNRLLACGRHL